MDFPTKAIIAILNLGLAAFVVHIAYEYAKVLSLRRRMPPGPLPLPLFGNIFSFPKDKQWKKLEEWSKNLDSPIITFWQGSTPVVVCNDAWSMADLCDKRANIYSSRHVSVLTGKIFGLHKFNQAGLPYGEQWRLHRRLTHTAANVQAAKSYQEVQANEAKIFMADTQSDQVDFTQALMRFTVSIVSIIAWGRRISSYQDNVLLAAQAFVGSANLGLPGKTYTEAIPWLARMPSWLNPLPQMLRRLAVSSNKYFYALSVEGAEAPNDNFARRLLREQEEHGLSKVEIANLTGNFIGAGVDTTTSTIITFVLAMCLFPDVQRRAHEEIDAVIGSDRYPDWSDEAQLPYVAALINETFRWRPAFALGGPPHAPTEDDTYNGLFIPKGTSVIGNLYAICRNPREYPDPEQFRPERFMADQKNPPYPNNRGHNAFGWGRRVCAGEPVARQSVYYIVVCLLWAYDIRPGADKNGKEVALDPNAYGSSQVNRPLPFNFRLLPRSEKSTKLIKEGAAAAQDALRQYDSESTITRENAQLLSLD
ncbi:cytochrome P450 [Hypoxylon rubiginosum]|uniref:Cytochrome P450 n=1 Tax=Hypoxylon rubiginosum TaxID=110542 RepID=A0ACC0CJT4_9PEZI|nr:cytochrome P450 [Hypoxylon rubiginosum]